MSTSDLSKRQLTLNIALRDDATLENFYCANRDEPALAAIQRQLGSTGEPIIYLYGNADSGRSHLLQAACHLADSDSVYLPLAELADYEPEAVLQGVETMKLVCLDDVDAVLGDDNWELALFHFYNRARDSGCRLLLAANCAPRLLTIQLADLQSRLSWGVVFQLSGADDATRQAILSFRAVRRGLQMPAEVAAYIMTRAPRSLSSLLDLLDQLDTASLVEKRALSIPFVKVQLGW